MSSDERQSAYKDSYDRHYGMCLGFPHTQPATKNVSGLLGVGGTTQYIIQTFRAPEAGDTVFITIIDGERATRVVLPPQVTAILHSQHDTLTTKALSARATAAAASRKAAGHIPFQKKKDKDQ